MGLLDNLGSAASGALGKGASGGINAILVQQLIAYLSKPGALQSVMGALQKAGLGNALQSWIGTGANLPVSPEQLRSVLGAGSVADIAKKTGLAEPEAASALSKLLPDVIDKLTPGGNAPPTQGDLSGMLSSVGKLLG
jgi:uncharacterized protein YidB (DUF937 family)